MHTCPHLHNNLGKVVSVKVNKKCLRKTETKSSKQGGIKVDYQKMADLGLFQIPEREPSPVKVTGKLLEYLEQIPASEQKGVPVKRTRRNGYHKPVHIPAACTGLAAACLCLILMSGAFFEHLQAKPEAVLGEETVMIERMADTATGSGITRDYLSPTPTPSLAPVETKDVSDYLSPTPSPTATPKPTKKPKPTSKPTPKPTLKPTTKPTPKPTTKPPKKTKPGKKVSKNGWVSLGKDWVITHYCPLSCCNGSYAGKTSTGAKPRVNRTIAVDPSVIPYGSRIKIEGLDYEFVAEDCGGKIKGKHIDVLVKNCTIARRLGKRTNVKVWIKK